MSPRDHHLLSMAHASAPFRGVRVTADRGVCRVPGSPWRRFEGPATMAGTITHLDDQEIIVTRGDAEAKVLLGDILDISDDVAYRELASPLTLQEALSFAFDRTREEAVPS